MSDNIKGRVLVLRILPPKLLARLQEKMSELEDQINNKDKNKNNTNGGNNNSSNNGNGSGGGVGISSGNPNDPTSSAAAAAAIMMGGYYGRDTVMSGIDKDGKVMNLDGVSCEPTVNESDIWNFRCDGVIYPARLTNLPCPAEIHKTLDHAMYYKCVDVGQILVVYENMQKLQEAENAKDYKVDGYPSFYHSGLTPPMKRVVQRRFKAREHKSEPPPRGEVVQAMTELKNLIAQITKDANKARGGRKGGGSSSAMSGGDTNKIVEEIEDVEVEYEPWMTDDGNKPEGIEFDETDALCYQHPEICLDPLVIEKNNSIDYSANSGSLSSASGGKSSKQQHTTSKNAGSTTKKKSKKKKKMDDGSACSSMSSASGNFMKMLSSNTGGVNSLFGSSDNSNKSDIDQAALSLAEASNDDALEFLNNDDFFKFD